MTNYGHRIIFIAIILSVFYSSIYADVAPWKSCPTAEDEAPSNCTIHELRIDPCKEGPQGKPCRLKRGLNASIEFDYTVNFDAPTLEGSAYWVNALINLPFLGMENNACLGTPCPTAPGQKQTYRQVFPISKKYPVRAYDVKWVLSSPAGQECCFVFQIRIHK